MQPPVEPAEVRDGGFNFFHELTRLAWDHEDLAGDQMAVLAQSNSRLPHPAEALGGVLDLVRQVLELMSSGSQIGRALFAPPGVPADRIAALRNAFDAMVKDRDFLDAAAKRKLVVGPTPGPEVEAVIQKVVSYSPAVVERARAVSGIKD